MYFDVLGTWFRGLLAIALIAAAALLVKEWLDELPTSTHARDPVTGTETVRALDTLSERLAAWSPRPNRSTGLLVGGALLLALALGGRIVSPRLWRRSGRRPAPGSGRTHRLKTRHGYELEIESHGPEEAPPLVFVHGVGSDRTQWLEAVEDLSPTFRVHTFDLLGHGASDRVAGAAHSVEASAEDLDDVLRWVEAAGTIVIGHSMGGMIAMSWYRRFEKHHARAAGLVLVHTTPQNPFETLAPVAFHRAAWRFVHRPLLHLTIPLAPVVAGMNRLAFANGSSHWSNDWEVFHGSETREQLDRAARLQASMDPAAVARFTLSMTRFDARESLGRIDLPTQVIAADGDRTTVPEASRRVAAGIRGAHLLVLEDARHLGFMERRMRFAEAIARFHEETLASGQGQRMGGVRATARN